MVGKRMGTGLGGRSDGQVSDDNLCPLCIEPLDETDEIFRPCPCGYRVCLFCYDRIKLELNALCPSCRAPYGSPVAAVPPASITTASVVGGGGGGGGASSSTHLSAASVVAVAATAQRPQLPKAIPIKPQTPTQQQAQAQQGDSGPGLGQGMGQSPHYPLLRSLAAHKPGVMAVPAGFRAGGPQKNAHEGESAGLAHAHSAPTDTVSSAASHALGEYSLRAGAGGAATPPLPQRLGQAPPQQANQPQPAHHVRSGSVSSDVSRPQHAGGSALAEAQRQHSAGTMMSLPMPGAVARGQAPAAQQQAQPLQQQQQQRRVEPALNLMWCNGSIPGANDPHSASFTELLAGPRSKDFPRIEATLPPPPMSRRSSGDVARMSDLSSVASESTDRDGRGGNNAEEGGGSLHGAGGSSQHLRVVVGNEDAASASSAGGGDDGIGEVLVFVRREHEGWNDAEMARARARVDATVAARGCKAEELAEAVLASLGMARMPEYCAGGSWSRLMLHQLPSLLPHIQSQAAAKDRSGAGGSMPGMVPGAPDSIWAKRAVAVAGSATGAARADASGASGFGDFGGNRGVGLTGPGGPPHGNGPLAPNVLLQQQQQQQQQQQAWPPTGNAMPGGGFPSWGLPSHTSGAGSNNLSAANGSAMDLRGRPYGSRYGGAGQALIDSFASLASPVGDARGEGGAAPQGQTPLSAHGWPQGPTLAATLQQQQQQQQRGQGKGELAGGGVRRDVNGVGPAPSSGADASSSKGWPADVGGGRMGSGYASVAAVSSHAGGGMGSGGHPHGHPHDVGHGAGAWAPGEPAGMARAFGGGGGSNKGPGAPSAVRPGGSGHAGVGNVWETERLASQLAAQQQQQQQQEPLMFTCPVCQSFACASNELLNQHVDECLNRSFIGGLNSALEDDPRGNPDDDGGGWTSK
eukprot:jgi/Mesvir1/7683/Mv11653-RA.1